MTPEEKKEYEDLICPLDDQVNTSNAAPILLPSAKSIDKEGPNRHPTQPEADLVQCPKSQNTVGNSSPIAHAARIATGTSVGASSGQSFPSQTSVAPMPYLRLQVNHDQVNSSTAALISPSSNSIVEEGTSQHPAQPESELIRCPKSPSPIVPSARTAGSSAGSSSGQGFASLTSVAQVSNIQLINDQANVTDGQETDSCHFEATDTPHLVPDQHEDDDEHCLETKARVLLDLITKEGRSFVPCTSFQSITEIVLKNLQEIQGAGDHAPIELSFEGGKKRKFKSRYIKLPTQAKCKASSNDKSKKRYVRDKTKAMKAYFEEIVEQRTENGKELALAVITKIAHEYDFIVHTKDKFRLFPEEVALIRDAIGTTTNGIYRLKSCLESIRPELRGLLLPSCIKAVLARVDGSDNFENKTVQRECIITKEGTKKGLRPFAFIVHPWEVIARIVEKTKVEGTYKPSETWMKAKNKCVITMNADKGSDINLSIRCANKEGGNSMHDTYCIASVEGPVCECIETEMETIFNDEYPIRGFLQGLLDQSYYVFSIKTQNNQCQSIVFQPTPKSDKVCVSRSIGVTLLRDVSTKESGVEFSESLSGSSGPPEVSIPASAENISVRLVFDDDNENNAVGIQFVVGTETKYTHRFRIPLKLVGGEIESIEASVEQIIGFPPNDGKQQLICIGIPSNSCRYACPTCICHRNDFGNWSERLWQAGVKLGLKVGTWPNKNAKLREGKWSFENCLYRYNFRTNNGQLLPNKGTEEEKMLSATCASVSKPIGLNVWPEINCGDPMHLSAGLINHTMNKIRKQLRAFEKNSEFMQKMHDVKKEVENMLDELDIKKKMVGNDDRLESILAPLHRESLKIRNEMTNALDRAKKLELLKLQYEDLDSHDLDEDESREVRESGNEIQKQIEEQLNHYDDLLEECKGHSDETGYGHYILLRKGLITFYTGLVQFLSGSSKKPQGKLEFVFNNALEHIGGGKFSAENGGFDQTNGRAMNTLEKFNEVADVCVLSYESDPKHEEIEKMFKDFKELASHLFELTTYMKSQKKRNADSLVERLVKFLAKYEELFPNESCYNKLHFVMWHVVEFVDRWETCGRLSAESHESIHTAFEKAKSAVCKMSSTSKRFSTLFARMTLDLKGNIAGLKKTVLEKTTGKARGKYKTNYANKRQDNVDFVASTFDKTITYEGEEYIILPCDGGLIEKVHLHQFVYVTTGRAPDDWVQCFADSKLLSDAKKEEAKYATYHRVS